MKQWSTIDKTGWARGPWDDEPDKMQWTDETTGLPCLLVRHSDWGNLCGYVAVPPGHPFHGQGFRSLGEVEIDVHGGLDFAGECQPGEDESTGICHVPEPGQPHDVWWFGFDCAHWLDLVPGMEAHLNQLMPDRLAERAALRLGWPAGTREMFTTRYRDIGYVQRECAHLAKQLARAVPHGCG